MDTLEGVSCLLRVENQSDENKDDSCPHNSEDSSENDLYNDEDDVEDSLTSDDHFNQSDISDGVYCSTDNEDDSDHEESAFGDLNPVHEPADHSHSVDIALLSIMDKHSLSYACVEDILRLMSASIPNFTSSSLHVLLKQYVEPKDRMTVHQCCGNCCKLLQPGACCTMLECIESRLPVSSFIEVQLDYQIQLLFTGKL